MKKLLTADEVAELFAVDRSTIYRWADAGVLPAIRLGPRTIRFNQDVLLRLLVEGSGVQLVGTRPPKMRQMPARTIRVQVP